MSEAPGYCRNCGEATTSAYCPACGQARYWRLTLTGLARSATRHAFGGERGVWVTLRTLLTSPGDVPRRYVAGERRRFLHPMSWFLLAATIQLLSIWINGDILINLIATGLNPDVIATLKNAGVEQPGVWAGERYVMLLQNGYTWGALLAFVLPTATAMRLLMWRRDHIFAEHLVWALYILGLVIAITGAVSPATVRLSPFWHGALAPLLYLVLAVWAGRGTYGGVWPALACLLATVVGFITFLLAIAVGQSVLLNPNLLPL